MSSTGFVLDVVYENTKESNTITNYLPVNEDSEINVKGKTLLSMLRLDKINQQIESIDGLYKSGAMDQDEYDKIKTRLLIKKKTLVNTDNPNNYS